MYQTYQALMGEYGPQGWWPADGPFEVMVGAILVQNTAWTNVERSIARLKQEAVLDARSLRDLHHEKLAAMIRSSGYFNVKAKRLQNFCHWYLQHGGYTGLKELSAKQLRQALLSVNGIGHETADDILLYAFDQLYFVVDAYTKRLFSRLHLLSQLASYEDIRQSIESNLARRELHLYQEFHALIVRHAKTICRTKPICSQCVLASRCPSKI